MKKSQKIIIVVLTLVVFVEMIVFTKVYRGSNNVTDESSQSSETVSGSNYNNDSSTETFPNLVTLTYDQWKELNQSNTKFVYVIVQTSCGYCLQYQPILNEIALEYEIPVYILDILTMTDSQIDEFLSTSAAFAQSPSTPFSIIVENGIEIDSLSGLASKEATIQFYQKNNLIS